MGALVISFGRDARHRPLAAASMLIPSPLIAQPDFQPLRMWGETGVLSEEGTWADPEPESWQQQWACTQAQGCLCVLGREDRNLYLSLTLRVC